MKQTKFNNGDMIAVTTPRGVTVAILAEDFTYEKPCMVECKCSYRHDGLLSVVKDGKYVDLYIHQDCLEVRLANEHEGLRMFSAIKAIGAEMPKCRDGEVKEFEPKDGDFVLVDNNIFGIYNRVGKPLHVASLDGKLIPNYTFGSSKRYLAPSERQLLLDALAKQGLTWNATEKRVEKVLWRAKEGETYFAAYFSDDKALRVPTKIEESFDSLDDINYATGDYFQHESDCQLLCDQLNAVVKANKESRVKIN